MVLEFINQLCLENLTNFSKLEKELGFGNGTIRKWSRSSPSVDKLLKVANYFGVSVDYILNGSGEQSSALSLDILRTYDSLTKEKRELAWQYMKLLARETEAS